MVERSHIKDSFKAAIPIMLGYVAIGIPCGILCAAVGLNALQVFLFSALFYSGAGQFMIPNMYLSGSPLASILASVSLVNTRQMLYAASFAPACQNISKPLAFFFAATVTDESFGVSTRKFEEGDWSVDRALMLNLFSQSSWTISNVVGALVSGLIDIPLQIAAFAMTSIFICLLVTQKMTDANVIAIVCAMLGVFACKSFGLSGPAILIGALIGVAVAFAYASIKAKGCPSGGGEALPSDQDGMRTSGKGETHPSNEGEVRP